MPFSNFQNGFKNGVTIRGTAILNTYAGSLFYLDSNTGSDGNTGTRDKPFATLDYAIGRCTANKGDVILIAPGHAETIESASAITIDVAGVSIVGLGHGADRPTFTFSTATSASMVASADSVTIENILGVAGIDGLINPVSFTGDDLYLDMEWQDASASVEAARAVLMTSVSKAIVKLKYTGFIAGNAVVNAIRMVGCSNVDLFTNFYGVNTTSWVEFTGTASTNVNVSGYMYTSGITNFTRDVVDTITGSTWFAQIIDGSAAKIISGGSGAALASDDISTIGTVVDAIQADVGDASGDTLTSANAKLGNSASTIPALITATETAVGTSFWIKKSMVSSAILASAAVDLTGVSSVGDLAVNQVILKTDSTGTAGGNNINILSDNAHGAPVFFAEAVASLGSNVTVTLQTASVTKSATVLGVGKKFQIQSTSADCTGAGVLDVYIELIRLTAGATVAAA